jgi:hypothetical protein
VRRSRRRDERETAIRERQGFGGSSDKGQIGQLVRGRFRRAPHVRAGLDPDHARIGERVRQLPAEDAGAGADIRHELAGLNRQDRQRGGRIVGPRPVVAVGNPVIGTIRWRRKPMLGH